MKLCAIVQQSLSLVFSRKLLGRKYPLAYFNSRHYQISPSLPSSLKGPAPIWGSNKHKTKKNIKLQRVNIMADPEIEKVLAPFRASVKEQVNNFFLFKRKKNSLKP